MENEKTVKKFEKPEIEIIYLTEMDIITSSPDQEGEIITHP